MYMVLTHTQGGFTAVICAAQAGHTDCLKALLEVGADKEAKSTVRQSGWGVLPLSDTTHSSGTHRSRLLRMVATLTASRRCWKPAQIRRLPTRRACRVKSAALV